MLESKGSAVRRESPTKEADTEESVTLYGFSADSENESGGPSPEEIGVRAYHCWVERGCPHGSPEVDWQRAEEELRAERQGLGQTLRAAHV